MGNFTSNSIKELCANITSGSLSASELVEESLACAQAKKELNALQYVNKEQALALAQQPRKGVLSGVPFVVKDNINSQNIPTTAGTFALANNLPKQNAPALERLVGEGAILLGKASMHELAFGITSNNAAMGAVKNPHDTSLIPGGSSGGSAAAVAAGVVPFALGTDTGGSCRIPAALCGVVGFRPSTGRYPIEGVVPISHTRDTVGPIARTVEDIIAIDSVLARTKNTTSANPPSKITLGLDQSVLCRNLSDEVQDCFGNSIKALRAAGVTIKEINLAPIWDHNAAFSFPVVLYEVMRDLPAYLEKYTPEISFEALIAQIKSPDVLSILQSQLGEEAMPEEAYKAALGVHRPKMNEIYKRIFAENNLNAIIFPTTPLSAAKIGEDETVTLQGEQVPTFPTYIRNTDLGSNLGVPGISIPAPSKGMPIGIEIDGIEAGDVALLSIARTVEDIIST